MDRAAPSSGDGCTFDSYLGYQVLLGIYVLVPGAAGVAGLPPPWFLWGYANSHSGRSDIILL